MSEQRFTPERRRGTVPAAWTTSPTLAAPVTVSHGVHTESLPVGNMTVGEIRRRYADRFDIDPHSQAEVDGRVVGDETRDPPRPDADVPPRRGRERGNVAASASAVACKERDLHFTHSTSRLHTSHDHHRRRNDRLHDARGEARGDAADRLRAEGLAARRLLARSRPGRRAADRLGRTDHDLGYEIAPQRAAASNGSPTIRPRSSARARSIARCGSGCRTWSCWRRSRTACSRTTTSASFATSRSKTKTTSCAIRRCSTARSSRPTMASRCRGSARRSSIARRFWPRRTPSGACRSASSALVQCLLDAGFNYSSEHHEGTSWFTESPRSTSASRRSIAGRRRRPRIRCSPSKSPG